MKKSTTNISESVIVKKKREPKKLAPTNITVNVNTEPKKEEVKPEEDITKVLTNVIKDLSPDASLSSEAYIKNMTNSADKDILAELREERERKRRNKTGILDMLHVHR